MKDSPLQMAMKASKKYFHVTEHIMLHKMD